MKQILLMLLLTIFCVTVAFAGEPHTTNIPDDSGEAAQNNETQEDDPYSKMDEDVTVDESLPKEDMFEVNKEIKGDLSNIFDTPKGEIVNHFIVAGEDEELQKQASIRFAEQQELIYSAEEKAKFAKAEDSFAKLMPEAKPISVGNIGIFNSDIKLQNPPLKVGDTILLTTKDLTVLTASYVTEMEQNKNIIIQSDDIMGEFIMGESVAYINEQQIALPMKVFIYNGNTYIAAAPFLQYFNINYAQPAPDTLLIFL